MKLGLKPDTEVGPDVWQGVADYLRVGTRLSNDREAAEEEGEREDVVDPDSREPPEQEDAAENEDSPPGGAFDRAWRGALPLISQLPRPLHPPVRYRIGPDLSVQPLYRRKVEAEDVQQALAEAVAQHIRKSCVALDHPGDQTRIPAVTAAHLAALIPDGHKKLLGAKRIAGIGNELHGFAIELPSGDSVTPQMLVDRTLPPLEEVPERRRPRVRYRIEADFAVRALQRPPVDLERAVAEAIARHIEETGTTLQKPGDWCAIPCIGGDAGLARLIPDDAKDVLGAEEIKTFGSVLKNFAIELPNGDVVTPQALMDAARSPDVRYDIESVPADREGGRPRLVVRNKGKKNIKRDAIEGPIAHAVARCLEAIGFTGEYSIDWSRAKSVALSTLVPDNVRQALGDSVDRVMKGFAIRLPNDERVTPQDFLDPESRRKRTTRSAALRLAADHPHAMPSGETWSDADWDSFEDTQRRNERRAARRDDGPSAGSDAEAVEP